MTQPQHVITLPPLEYQFLQELMARVVHEGLIVPDELPYSASLWTRIKQAQVVTPPAPEEQPEERVGQAAPAPLEGAPDEHP
jgi:hypothetical protein